MLDIKKLIAKILNAIKVDYVVEQGKSGIWTYRKWNSGIVELWGVKSINNVTINANAVYNFVWDEFPFQLAYAPPVVNVNYAATSWIDICAFYTNAGVGAIDSYARNMASVKFSGTVTGFANVKGFWTGTA